MSFLTFAIAVQQKRNSGTSACREDLGGNRVEATKLVRALRVRCIGHAKLSLPKQSHWTSMKTAYLLSLAFSISLLCTAGWAAQHDQHTGHHPAGVASAPLSKPLPGKASADMAKMDAHTKAMRQMHNKVMNSKSPEERNVLMAELMKMMQDGMAMINSTPSAGMGSMKSGLKGDMATHHQLMEKRMEMMAASMQMMMDRLPVLPAK